MSMKTDGNILMMMMKQIINNNRVNNQHDHDEADAVDTNEDVARISKMTTAMTMTKNMSMMTANQIIILYTMMMTRTTTC